MDQSRSMKKMKEALHNPVMDEMLKDKMTGEQQDTLKEFKDVIYDATKKHWNGPAFHSTQK